MADAPRNNAFPAQPYREHTGDSHPSLEKGMYAAIKQITFNSTFTILTGDIVEGAVWLVDETEVTNDLNNVYGQMITSSELQLVYPFGSDQCVSAFSKVLLIP